jgi:hypothetical protein
MVKSFVPSSALLRFLRARRSANETLKTKLLERLKIKMPQVKFTAEDLLERTQLTPGWRVLKCKEMTEGPGKSDPQSIVYACIFVVESPEKGVPIRHWFSEKAQGRIVDYVKCFIPGGKAEANKVYELNDTVGFAVEGYCAYDPKQGYNTILDWRPVQKAQAPQKAQGA